MQNNSERFSDASMDDCCRGNLCSCSEGICNQVRRLQEEHGGVMEVNELEKVVLDLKNQNKLPFYQLVKVGGIVYSIAIEKYESADEYLEKAKSVLNKKD